MALRKGKSPVTNRILPSKRKDVVFGAGENRIKQTPVTKSCRARQAILRTAPNEGRQEKAPPRTGVEPEREATGIASAAVVELRTQRRGRR